MRCVSTQTADSAMKMDKCNIEKIVQDEIDRCDNLVGKLIDGPRGWGKTVAALIMRDIDIAKRAIEDKDSAGMHRSLRALRENH